MAGSDSAAAMCRSECPLSRGLSPTFLSVQSECCVYDKTCRELKRFGFRDFRPGQLDAVLSILHGNDVFVRMATGCGKSLCMYLPPLVHGENATGVIISPLVGLMDEQVHKLHSYKLSAVRVSEGNSQKYEDVKCGRYRYVFMSPEAATTRPWRKIFEEAHFKANLSLLAVDEAHCITEWGKDFRKSFSMLGDLRALTKAPVLSMTASAPPHIEAELVQLLHLKNPVFVKSSLNRRNIFLCIRTKSKLEDDLSGIAKCLTSSDPNSIPKTIIFFNTKALVLRAYVYLRNQAYHKHYVGAYHASLRDETKKFISFSFSSSSAEMRCLCSTIAFGMGIDIPDIALSVVYGVPDTICQFYQLCGRAGRNGSPSIGVLFYNKKQLKGLKDDNMKAYCELGKENCQRQHLLRSLGDCEQLQQDQSKCCCLCTPKVVPYPKLALMMKRNSCKRKPPEPPKEVLSKDDINELTKRLIETRDSVVESSTGLRMLGSQVVCDSVVISEICRKAPCIRSVQDMSKVSNLRPQFHEPMFRVVSAMTESILPPTKQ